MIGLTAFPIIFRRNTSDKGEIQMKELDAVKLVEDYENIKAGTEGVIVHEYDGRAFEVEFFDDEDNTIDVVTTPTKYLVFVVSYEDNDK